jgi:DtxR family Mn-dependent transcriptional regulator
MYTLVEENYLKALYNLSIENGEVSINELSVALALKMPTVNSMVKKMSEKGLVRYEKYKPLSLTEKGSKEAGLIIRKHRLTEMFLVEIMGIGWESVHEIAEQIEHIKSPDFFTKMDSMLGYPTEDPHGSPIPDKHGKIAKNNYVSLDQLQVGEQLELKSVVNTSKSFLEMLNSKSIELGTVFKVLKKEPFDNSVLVAYSKNEEFLSDKVQERLFGTLKK